MSAQCPDWLDKPSAEWPEAFRIVYGYLSEFTDDHVSAADVFQWLTEDGILVAFLQGLGVSEPDQVDIETMRLNVIHKLGIKKV